MKLTKKISAVVLAALMAVVAIIPSQLISVLFINKEQ